jgi:hypothetical protein
VTVKSLSQSASAQHARLLRNLRALNIDLGRLPEIPSALATWISRLTPTDIEQIRGDVRELERLGLT